MTLEKTKRDGPGKRGMIFAEFIRSDWQSQILAKVRGRFRLPLTTPTGKVKLCH